jgi:AcrR family transcriptional regulator
MKSESLNKQSVDRIIACAEEAFSKNGYHGTSIRELTKKARVNLAAINYHFGNKESLYCEVISRRLEPLNRLRLSRLTSATELSGNNPIPLALIIDIFARPLFELQASSANEGIHILQLIGRSMAEPLPFVDKLLATELHPITTRFGHAIRRHIPSITTEEFMWRLSFVVGAMHHTLATMHRMKELTHGLCQNDDSEGALRHFTQFAVSALIAPAPPSG